MLRASVHPPLLARQSYNTTIVVSIYDTGHFLQLRPPPYNSCCSLFIEITTGGHLLPIFLHNGELGIGLRVPLFWPLHSQLLSSPTLSRGFLQSPCSYVWVAQTPLHCPAGHPSTTARAHSVGLLRRLSDGFDGYDLGHTRFFAKTGSSHTGTCFVSPICFDTSKTSSTPRSLGPPMIG